MRLFSREKRRLAKALSCAGIMVIFLGGVLEGRSILDLKVDNLDLEQVMIGDVIRELAHLGVSVSFEEACSEEKGEPFSLHLQDVTIRQVLDEIIQRDQRYAWKAYALGKADLDFSWRIIVNIAPREAWEDQAWPMNVLVTRGTIDRVPPNAAVSEIAILIPELRRHLYPEYSGGAGSRIVGVGPNVKREEIFLEFESLTVREILNEIALRTGVMGWSSECTDSEWGFSWQALF